MKIEPRTLKGFRDFLPNETRKRAYVIDKLKSVFESYGFEPLETPTLEYAVILTGKYGDEGDKLMYKFKDNGDRDVAMRYDQTVPLARVIAESVEKLPLPFKRYQIQNVWRAENTQKGRFREFLQCDIDTVGTNSSNADAEIISCLNDSLKALGFKNYKILVNDRALFKNFDNKAVTIIDKLKKIGEEGVRKELSDAGLDESILSQIQASQPTELLKEILKNLDLVFEPTLARGLDYYTGLIIEAEIEGYSGGSIAGGGRYDELIGIFSDKQIPAVGLAFGFDRLIEAMDELNLFPKTLYTSKVLVLNLPGMQEKAFETASKLRNESINTEAYLDSNVEKSKQYAYAEKKAIPYTVVPNNDDTYTLGWKNEKDEIEKKENIDFTTLLELLSK